MSATDLVYGLFRPECYDTFFVQHEFLDVPCLKHLVSKCLSYGIILGAVFVKIPQILNIVRAKSTQGLSPAMYVMENLGYLITVIYNLRHGYPFSTFGESVFLLLQGFALVCLFAHYNRKVNFTFVAGIGVFASFAYFLYVTATLDQLALFQTSTIAVFASSRLPQIRNNFLSGSTGVLSVITVAMNFAGTSARIFTTLQEVDDSVVLLGTISSWLLNTIILLQVIWYWNSRGAANKVKSDAKKKTKKAQ